MRKEIRNLAGNGGPCNWSDQRYFKNFTICAYSHVLPPSLETKILDFPLLATPTKMRGVAVPFDPEVESKVTKAIPTLSVR